MDEHWNALCTVMERYLCYSIKRKIEEFILFDAIYDPRHFANSFGGGQGWISCPFCSDEHFAS